MFNLSHNTILILGLGATGLSFVQYLLSKSPKQLILADTRSEPPTLNQLKTLLNNASIEYQLFLGQSFESIEHQFDLSTIDFALVSPGLDIRTGLAQTLIHTYQKEVFGDIELFARIIPNDIPMIAITGSNGKSTVTSMCYEVCQASGLNTLMAGNIGLPVLDALIDIEKTNVYPDAIVLELSSFQLETTRNLSPTVATVLNISQDHMDRYDSLDEYAQAKTYIFHKKCIQVLNQNDSYSVNMAKKDYSVVYFDINHIDEYLKPNLTNLSIAGLHNIENAIASYYLCKTLNIKDEIIFKTLQNFKGLSHRVEKVTTINGVTYYDDSKGTNVGSTIAALSGLGCPVVLIAGGDGKGQDFSPLRNPVLDYAKAVILIGRDAPLIEACLANQDKVIIIRCQTLEDAVIQSEKIATNGDAVLLSPACASWDMFNNYAHRAKIFIDSVNKLKK